MPILKADRDGVCATCKKKIHRGQVVFAPPGRDDFMHLKCKPAPALDPADNLSLIATDPSRVVMRVKVGLTTRSLEDQTLTGVYLKFHTADGAEAEFLLDDVGLVNNLFASLERSIAAVLEVKG